MNINDNPLYIPLEDRQAIELRIEAERLIGKRVKIKDAEPEDKLSHAIGIVLNVYEEELVDIDNFGRLIAAYVEFPELKERHKIPLSKLILAEDEEKQDDPVNHPSHYTDGKYEFIEFIEACTAHPADFYIGNAIKYISRAGKKDPNKKKEDLEKAIWYLQRYSLWRNERNCKSITIDDYIKDKGLQNSPQGLALELLLKNGSPESAIKALRLTDCFSEEENHEESV